jgi:hypothetical protein
MGRTCGTYGGHQKRVEHRALEPSWGLRSDLEVACTDVAQRRVKGRAVVSRVINLGVL